MQPANPRAHRRGMLVCFVLAISALACLRSAEGELKSSDAAIDVLWMGNRSSQIEPCGCIQNKLGGMQYEATLLARYDRARSLRLDVGGFTSTLNHPEDAMRTRYALEAMAGALDLDAINIAVRDLRLGGPAFTDLAEHYPGVADRLVSANIRFAGGGGAAFHPYRMIEKTENDSAPTRILITGATEAEPDPMLVPPADSAAAEGGYQIGEVIPALKSTLALAPEHDLCIVLFHGSAKSAKAIAGQVSGIDAILCSAPEPEDAKGGHLRVGETEISWLQGSEGKLLGQMTLSRAADSKAWSQGESQWLRVSPDLAPVQSLVDIIDQYKQHTEEMLIRKPPNTNRVYAGARSCATCHATEFEQWESTPHARALQTLVDRGMQFDSRCLECHTVGFTRDNGFYNVRESMTMAGVQCETCHGPSAEHADLEGYLQSRRGVRSGIPEIDERRKRAAEVVPKKHPEAELCLKCHTPENDDHFDYDLKIAKVRHAP